MVDAAHAAWRRRRGQRRRYPRGPHPAAHHDGEPRGEAVHERGGELLRRRRGVRQQGRRGAAQLPGVAAVRPAGRRELRDPRVEDPAGRAARVVPHRRLVDALAASSASTPSAARQGRPLQRVRPPRCRRGLPPGREPWDCAWGDPKKKPNPSLGTIEKPPFYAAPMYPGAIADPWRTARRRVGRACSRRRDGEPIPGLFASGNCSNGSAAGAYVGPAPRSGRR